MYTRQSLDYLYTLSLYFPIDSSYTCLEKIALFCIQVCRNLNIANFIFDFLYYSKKDHIARVLKIFLFFFLFLGPSYIYTIPFKLISMKWLVHRLFHLYSSISFLAEYQSEWLGSIDGRCNSASSEDSRVLITVFTQSKVVLGLLKVNSTLARIIINKSFKVLNLCCILSLLLLLLLLVIIIIIIIIH